MSSKELAASLRWLLTAVISSSGSEHGHKTPGIAKSLEGASGKWIFLSIGLMREMLTAAIALCVNAHIPAITGIFTTRRLHQVAGDLGFQKYHEIQYKDYKDDGKVLFGDIDSGDTSAALMAYRISEVEELLEVEAQHSSRFNIQSIDDGSDSGLAQEK